MSRQEETENGVEFIKVATAALWELTTKKAIQGDLLWALQKIITMNQSGLEWLTGHTDFITALPTEPSDPEGSPAATQFGRGYYCHLDENGEPLKRWTAQTTDREEGRQ